MGRVRKKSENPQHSTKQKLNLLKKERKQKLKEKRARLIVRNLPFQASQENLKEHFEKFGEVSEVQILKKEDGKMVGCGFVQFKLVQKAAKARYHLNGKPFLDRNLIVEFAQAKDKYKNVKESEQSNEDEVKVKEEPVDESQQDGLIETVKVETDSLKEGESKQISSERIDIDESNIDSEGQEEDSSEDHSDNDECNILPEKDQPPEKKAKFESNDVVEGRTIFIKNVPFDATNEDLKECMKQFGPVYYALICIDKYTEHSKGTAFVKFVNAEDAEKALNAGTELTLLGNVLDCHKALARNEIQQKAECKKQDKTTKKDSRNLFLVKEGVILAGSKAAEGVSASDMAKRLQLEQYKTQMLRNLNMFVSRDRLVVHNLPGSWDDKKFRALIIKSSPKNAVIKECRVMRDLKNVDESGLGCSKEFGFVTFNRHEDALFALRALNNNPNIFSAHKRPIVAFSIENKTMIKAKQKRLEKSRLTNPKSKGFDPNVVKANKARKQQFLEFQDSIEGKDFAGVTAKPGVQKMRSKYNLKTQARLHYENLKKEKKKAKFAKQSLKEKKKDFTKQPKQKINKKKKIDDNFNKLVSDYKKKLLTKPEVKKTKWYEQ